MSDERKRSPGTDSARRTRLSLIGAMWLATALFLLLAILYFNRYWERLLYIWLIGIGVAAAAGLAYLGTVRLRGRGVRLPDMKRWAAYAAAACLIVLVFQGMASFQVQLNRAGAVADVDMVLRWNAGYAVLGVPVGVLANVSGLIRLIRGQFDLNGWIIPAFALAYLGAIYKTLHWHVLMKFGLDPAGWIGFVERVLSITDLQLPLLFLAGYLFVRGVTVTAARSA